MVAAQDGVRGAKERRRQGPVVGQEEEAGRVEVEAADRVETPGPAAEQLTHRLPALRVGERAHHAARLVQHHRAPCPARVDALAIDRHQVALRHRARAERPHDHAVDGDAARQDERLGMAARGDPGGAQELLQTLAAGRHVT